MSDLSIYLLKVSGVFSLLTLTYFVLFRRLTFHVLNRGLLLAIIPLSLCLPVLEFDFQPSVNYPIDQFEWIQYEFVPAELDVEATTKEHSFDIWSYSAYIYWLGFSICVTLLVANVYGLFQKFRKSKSRSTHGISIVESDVNAVFSCLNWVFIPKTMSISDDHPIIKHELAHIRLRHSLDLLITELFVAVTWFNPFVYLFRRLIRSVHEYQADQRVMSENIVKSDYLKAMLDSLSSQYHFSLTSSFSSSTIKNRIEMISKNKSNRILMGIYVLFVPVLLVSLMAFAEVNFAGIDSKITGLISTDSTIIDNKTSTYSELTFASPLPEHRITSGFGLRMHPIIKARRMHRGVDFSAQKGTIIMSPAAGKISLVKQQKEAYGNQIFIDHGHGYVTFYAHLDEILVTEGGTVQKGQSIGTVGNSGRSTAPHLHFEIRKDGNPLNPEHYIGVGNN